jgi:Na+/serine symporter
LVGGLRDWLLLFSLIVLVKVVDIALFNFLLSRNSSQRSHDSVMPLIFAMNIKAFTMVFETLASEDLTVESGFARLILRIFGLRAVSHVFGRMLLVFSQTAQNLFDFGVNFINIFNPRIVISCFRSSLMTIFVRRSAATTVGGPSHHVLVNQ